MDDTEIDALDPQAFERMLHDRWAVSRRDIYVGSITHLVHSMHLSRRVPRKR